MGYHYTVYRRIKIIFIKSIDINVLLRNNMPFLNKYTFMPKRKSPKNY